MVEPPWGVEPQTYALRVDLLVSASAAITEPVGQIHAFGRNVRVARLQFVDTLVDCNLGDDGAHSSRPYP